MSEPTAPGEDEDERHGELVPFPGYEIEPDVIEGEIVDEPPPTGPGQGGPRRPASPCSTSTRRGPGGTSATSRSAPPSSPGACGMSRTTVPLRAVAPQRPRRPATRRPPWSGRSGWPTFRKDRHDAPRRHGQGARRACCWSLPKIALGRVRRARRVRHPAGRRDQAHSRGGRAVPGGRPRRRDGRHRRSPSRGGRSCWPLPWIAAGALWHVGRGYANARTGWTEAGKQDGEDAGLVVTADTVVLALQHLPIPALRKAFKDGWKPTFHTLPVRDGRGYSAVFSLPLGVTAEMIADQRPVLARNVHRAEIEVWPSTRRRPGPARPGPSPCGSPTPASCPSPRRSTRCCTRAPPTCSRACPAACRPAATRLDIPVVGNNFVVRRPDGAGQEQRLPGDHARLRAGSARRAGRVRVREQRRLRRLPAAAGPVRQGRRGRRDRRRGAPAARAVRRGRAPRGAARRPRRQEGHAPAGAAAPGPAARSWRCSASATSCSATTSTARWPPSWPPRRSSGPARPAITLLFDTQSSRKEAIPPKLVELVSVNACFYVKTWRSNDGFLGDGSFAAGIRATELRPGRDRGTSLITGVSDAQFELLKWYFVEVDDDTGFDAAADVIARAVAAGRAGHARRGQPRRRRDRGAGPARRPGRGARRRAGQAPRRCRPAARPRPDVGAVPDADRGAAAASSWRPRACGR